MSSATEDPADTPVTVVEGDAVELPSEPAAHAAQQPPPVYEPEPFAARAYASDSSAAAPASRSGWPDAGIDLSERPEYVVGAAFGGGLILALILRKLGN